MKRLTGLVRSLGWVRRWKGPLVVLGGLSVYGLLAPMGWAYADTARYRFSAETVPEA